MPVVHVLVVCVCMPWIFLRLLHSVVFTNFPFSMCVLYAKL